MGAACCECVIPEDNSATRGALKNKILSPGDFELWQKVDSLWIKHGLSRDEGLDMQKAIPLLKEINRQLNKQSEPTEEQISQIFNQIDEDGNQSIERDELFNFLKVRNYFDFSTLINIKPESKRRNTLTIVRQREDDEVENVDYSNSLFRNRVKMI